MPLARVTIVVALLNDKVDRRPSVQVLVELIKVGDKVGVLEGEGRVGMRVRGEWG